MHLAAQEQQQINGLVAEVEAASGAEFVVAVVGKADAYPEIPWKAFSLGAATAALLVALVTVLNWNWPALNSVLPALLIVLGAGLACAFSTVFVPAIARLFLDPLRAEAEVEQYARAMFLDRRMFETRERVGVLILISRFERKAAIVADVAVARHIPDAQLDGIVSEMVVPLSQGHVASAAETALRRIGRQLHGKLHGSAGTDEIVETLVQERGA
jgi:putative membrane protein